MSRQRLADDLDLSKRTILNIIEGLVLRGYIILDPKTKYMTTFDEYHNMMTNKQDWVIGMPGKNGFISGKIKQNDSGEEISPSNLNDSENNSSGGEESSQIGEDFSKIGEKSSPNNNNKENNTKDNIYIVEKVLECLNKEVNARFSAKTPATIKFINARIKEGYCAEDFETVIKSKAKEWLRDPVMKQYLRPITLFGSKFESYLNASIISNPQKPTKTPTGEGTQW